MDDTFRTIMTSWLSKDGIHSTAALLSWSADQKKRSKIFIERIPLDKSRDWFYDDVSGKIRNRQNTFFSVAGARQYRRGEIIAEQPLIVQPEIGLLGIIGKKIDGVLHFLMQAKIEPGNINHVQISPTIQATRSNFRQKHGGKKPPFLDEFMQAGAAEKLVDQIQSEQSSRFYKKRNRNVILLTENAVDERSTHRWMTLGQIKEFMKIDNLVNMDTRTVISCIPVSQVEAEPWVIDEMEANCTDKALFRSMTGTVSQRVLTDIYHRINDFKVSSDTETMLVRLDMLKDWAMGHDHFSSVHPFPYRLIFCDISIEGREVNKWSQPLVESLGSGIFGLLCCDEEGIRKFLVRLTPEIGCFDGVEIGPTVQQEAGYENDPDEVMNLFYRKLSAREGILADVFLSEEGGRFYHEENRNVIILIQQHEIPATLPADYFWCDYKTLNRLVQGNNCLNIQLRNLLALLEV